MLMILVLQILHKILNHLSQCRLGVQLDLCIFGALAPIRLSSNDRGRAMSVRNQTSQASVTSPCPFRAHTRLFTDHRMSGLPMRDRGILGRFESKV